MDEQANDNTAPVHASSAEPTWFGWDLGSTPSTTGYFLYPERWPTIPLRIRCCVPFCQHTKRNVARYAEWICGEHWKNVPRKKRRVWQRLRRQARAGGNPDPERTARLWQRLKRIATERGIEP